MSESAAVFVWVGLTLPILIGLQRWVHRHLHGVSLLLTGNAQWALVVYALLLLPGVFLHEISHWLTAGMLGIRTGRFSLIPRRQKNGTIQLGYVEYYQTSRLDPIREALVGGAPLIFGTIAILLIGLHVFEISQIAAAIQIGEFSSFTVALGKILSANDFLLWLYLLFAISNAMLPSSSDRRAWPLFILVLVLLGLILFLLGLQPLLWRGLAGPAVIVFGYLGLAFSMAIGVDLLVMVLILMLETILSKVKRVEVVYGDMEQVAKHQL